MISIPLYLLFMSAILVFGRLLSELYWVSNTAYHLVYFAAETTAAMRSSKVTSVKEVIVPLQNEVFRDSPLKDIAVTSSTNNVDKTVTIGFSAKLDTGFMRGILNFSGLGELPFSFEATAPLMVSDGLTQVVNEFRNPSTIQQCCIDSIDGGPSPTLCVECANDSSCLPQPPCS